MPLRMPRHHRPTLMTRMAATAAAGLAALALGSAGPVWASDAPAGAAASGTPAARSSAARVLPMHVTADEAQSALDSWTPERMAAADGHATRIGDITPDSASDTASPDDYGSEDDHAPIAQQVAPVPHIGRLFFRRDGFDDSCTGNVVRSANRSTFATAAHCATLKGVKPTEMVFVPGYHDGIAPYGRWPVVGGVVNSDFGDSGYDLTDDTAFLVVARNGAGADITSVVGASPVAFDQPGVKEGTVYGYPAQDRFTGETLQRCHGQFGELTSFNDYIDCDLNGGASGGPIFAGNGPDGAQYGNENASDEDEDGSPYDIGVIWLAETRTALAKAETISPRAAMG